MDQSWGCWMMHNASIPEVVQSQSHAVKCVEWKCRVMSGESWLKSFVISHHKWGKLGVFQVLTGAYGSSQNDINKEYGNDYVVEHRSQMYVMPSCFARVIVSRKLWERDLRGMCSMRLLRLAYVVLQVPVEAFQRWLRVM